MQLWLHSDWHWKHENLYGFIAHDGLRTRREFPHATQGDLAIEGYWREMVKPEDHVWCLGDLTMFRGKHMVDAFIAFFSSLPGHKRLILGNHDHYDVAVYAAAGFKKIRGSNMIDGVLCTHYPTHPGSIGGRAIGNAHGHIHRNPSPVGPYVNLSVEATGYKPVAIEDVQARLRRLRDV